MAIVSMGRLGGHETSYGCDADVMFVHEPLPGADAQEASRAAHAVANELRRLLAQPGSDPALEVDADLRPEGKQGPLVRTLESYAAYYAKWSAVWEAQALLRAEAVVGDRELCDRFVELVDPLRYPADGLSAGRRPRGAPDQGPGGQGAAAPRRRPGDPPQARSRRAVRHRVDRPAAPDAARRRRTRAAHDPHAGRAARGGRRPTCSPRTTPTMLVDAWRLVSRVRNAITLVRGKAVRPAAARRARARRGRQRAGLPGGRVRRAGQRLPALHPAGARRRRAGLLGVTAAQRPARAPWPSGARSRSAGPGTWRC